MRCSKALIPVNHCSKLLSPKSNAKGPIGLSGQMTSNRAAKRITCDAVLPLPVGGALLSPFLGHLLGHSLQRYLDQALLHSAFYQQPSDLIELVSIHNNSMPRIRSEGLDEVPVDSLSSLACWLLLVGSQRDHNTPFSGKGAFLAPFAGIPSLLTLSWTKRLRAGGTGST